MYEKTITIDAARPNIPLDPVWGMRYSAGHMMFHGIPQTMQSAVLVLVLAEAETPFVLQIDMHKATPEIMIENGAMTAVGQGDYYVYGFDSALRIFGLGQGKITITDAPTLSAAGGVTPVGNKVTVYAPETGKYYWLTAEINDDGDATVKLTDVEETT